MDKKYTRYCRDCEKYFKTEFRKGKICDCCKTQNKEELSKRLQYKRLFKQTEQALANF